MSHFYYFKCATHYWKLDSQSITIYDSYRLEKKLQEILLTDIKKANLCGLSMNSKDELINGQKCLFILSTMYEVYYCGMGNADQNSTMNVLARNFYNIFKMVFLPYANRNGSKYITSNYTTNTNTIQFLRHQSFIYLIFPIFFQDTRQSFKISAPKYEEKVG